MAAVVTAASGYDLGYVWKGQAQGGTQREQSAGGYYINAAQAGEAPGRWFGKGAEALGFTAGQQVDRKPYEAVYRQVDPRDGTQLGRKPGGYAKYADHLGSLLAAEPHATSERIAELERQAAQATRKSPAYTDVTVSLSKSVSILHASIRENARRARLAGDGEAAAYWDAREAEYQQVLQDANRAGLEHLERWAVDPDRLPRQADRRAGAGPLRRRRHDRHILAAGHQPRRRPPGPHPQPDCADVADRARRQVARARHDGGACATRRGSGHRYGAH